MPDTSQMLKTKDALDYTGMTKNFLMDSGEVQPVRRGRGIFFNRSDLDAWKALRDRRSVFLDLDDYAKCFDFALAMYYRGYTTVDWGSSRRREAGQDITNWIRGQLGEIATQKFLRTEIGLAVELDFDLHEEIVAQDIIGVVVSEQRRDPMLKVAIKATKFRNCYLILGEKEVESPERGSDIYILTRIDMPDDHLLRVTKASLSEILRNQKYFDSYKEKIGEFEPIRCEVVGFCPVEELEKVNDRRTLTKILGTSNPKGARYMKVSGKLRRDWTFFRDRL